MYVEVEAAGEVRAGVLLEQLLVENDGVGMAERDESRQQGERGEEGKLPGDALPMRWRR